MRKISWRIFACLATVTLGATGLAIEGKAASWGTGTTTRDSVLPLSNIGTISPAITIKGAQYGTGGVGLRNRGGGAIEVSGVIGPVKAAYLYWANITSGTPTSANSKVLVQRLLPSVSSSVVVTGALVGYGQTPCWSGTRINVYRAAVPLAVANGNGEYQLLLPKGASGLTNGADPWTGVTFPLAEGASLVIVGTGRATVAIYDKVLAGHTFTGQPGLIYSLKLPVVAPGNLALFDTIGADGQHGQSRTAVLPDSDETTVLNGTPIAGPGSAATDSDWNGDAALPLPQLWDDAGHDITAETPGGTTALNFTIASTSGSTFDCLTPVANVVSVQ